MRKDTREFSNAVGLTLRLVREQAGIEQGEMADRMRCSQALIAKIERGHYVKLWRFALWGDVCKVPCPELMDRCVKAAALLQRTDMVGDAFRCLAKTRSAPIRAKKQK